MCAWSCDDAHYHQTNLKPDSIQELALKTEHGCFYPFLMPLLTFDQGIQNWYENVKLNGGIGNHHHACKVWKVLLMYQNKSQGLGGWTNTQYIDSHEFF